MSTWYYRFEPADPSTLGDLRKLLVSIVGHEPDDEQGGSARFEIRGSLFDEKISPELQRMGFTGSVTFDGETQGYPIEYWSYEDGQRTEEETSEEDPYYAYKDYTFTPDDPSSLKDLLDILAPDFPNGFDPTNEVAIPAVDVQGNKFDNVEWGRGEISEELERLEFSGTVTVHKEGLEGDPVDHWTYESGKKVVGETGPASQARARSAAKKKATRKKVTKKRGPRKKARR